LTASARGTPPRICPVIMLGRETTPVTEIEIDDGHQRATERLALYWSGAEFAYQSGAGAIATHWPKRAPKKSHCRVKPRQRQSVLRPMR